MNVWLSGTCIILGWGGVQFICELSLPVKIFLTWPIRSYVCLANSVVCGPLSHVDQAGCVSLPDCVRVWAGMSWAFRSYVCFPVVHVCSVPFRVNDGIALIA